MHSVWRTRSWRIVFAHSVTHSVFLIGLVVTPGGVTDGTTILQEFQMQKNP